MDIYRQDNLHKVIVQLSYNVPAGGWSTIRTYTGVTIPPKWFSTNDGAVTLRIGVDGNKLEAFNASSSAKNLGLGFVYIF